MVVIVLLFILCFSMLWGMCNIKLEWLGIVFGLVGIILFNIGSNLLGNLLGVMLILLVLVSWVFGLVWSLWLVLLSGVMFGVV